MRTWHGHYGAAFIHTYAEVPVMHLFGSYRDGKDFTLCGREFTVWLDYRHAAKFARKCRVCDAAGQRGLTA